MEILLQALLVCTEKHISVKENLVEMIKISKNVEDARP